MKRDIFYTGRLLHTAFSVEVVLDYVSASADEVILSVELAENNSISDVLADKTDDLTLNVIELLLVEFIVVEDDSLSKVTYSEIVNKDGILSDDTVDDVFDSFISSHESHENAVGIDLALVAFSEVVKHRSLVF